MITTHELGDADDSLKRRRQKLKQLTAFQCQQILAATAVGLFSNIGGP